MSKNEKIQPESQIEPKTTTSSVAPDKANTQKFSLDMLRAHCRKLFNVSTIAFDGATSGLSGDFTTDEIARIINEWCEKPIAPTKEKEAK